MTASYSALRNTFDKVLEITILVFVRQAADTQR